MMFLIVNKDIYQYSVLSIDEPVVVSIDPIHYNYLGLTWIETGIDSNWLL